MTLVTIYWFLSTRWFLVVGYKSWQFLCQTLDNNIGSIVLYRMEEQQTSTTIEQCVQFLWCNIYVQLNDICKTIAGVIQQNEIACTKYIQSFASLLLHLSVYTPACPSVCPVFVSGLEFASVSISIPISTPKYIQIAAPTHDCFPMIYRRHEP